MYALHVMPALLLKRSPNSSSEDHEASTKTEVREMEKWRAFAAFERSDRPSKSVTKDWKDEKHPPGIKKVP